jgi:hypothetical protein
MFQILVGGGKDEHMRGCVSTIERAGEKIISGCSSTFDRCRKSESKPIWWVHRIWKEKKKEREIRDRGEKYKERGFIYMLAPPLLLG